MSVRFREASAMTGLSPVDNLRGGKQSSEKQMSVQTAQASKGRRETVREAVQLCV